MTPERLAELRAACGPPPPPTPEQIAACDNGGPNCGGCFVCCGPSIVCFTERDVLPLLDEIERLQAEREEWKAQFLLTPEPS